jgi:hypothetical protein
MVELLVVSDDQLLYFRWIRNMESGHCSHMESILL